MKEMDTQVIETFRVPEIHDPRKKLSKHIIAKKPKVKAALKAVMKNKSSL